MCHRLVRISALLIVLASLVFSLPGPVLAMPFQAAVDYPLGTRPIYVAAGDFNKDGKPDLAVVLNSLDSVGIMINRGGGVFDAAVTYAVGGAPQDIAVGDFNKDGNLDLAIVTSSKYVSVLLGRGDGTFNAVVKYTVSLGPQSVAVGDFNKDGNPDLVVTNFGKTTVSVLLGKGDGTFNTAVNYTTGNKPYGVAVGDFNGDSKPDLAVNNYSDDAIAILLGNGDGTFNAPVSYATGDATKDVIVADFNGDGKSDLAAVNEGTFNVSILMGRGDGTFNAAVNYTVGSYPADAVAGDFNYDGKPDLAVTNYGSSTISILTGKGDGTFDTAVTCALSGMPWGIATADFKGHDAADLVATTLSNNVVILFNTSRPATTTTSIGTGQGSFGLNTDAGTISNVTWQTPADMHSSVPSGMVFPYGIFGFNISRLTPGQTVRVTLNFPNPLPLSTKYLKFVNGSVVDVSSLVTRVNEYTLILALTDGGLGDADGVANGTIIDPGGPAFPLNTAPQSSSATMPQIPQKPVSLSNITVKSASLSATKVTPGTPVTVTASVANTGMGNGASVVKVYVNGTEEAQQGVSVNSGSTSQVSFDISRNEPGTYTVYVGGTNAGSFTVDQFTPDTMLYISGALIFFAFILGVIWMSRRKA